jgi:hypothetical protein
MEERNKQKLKCKQKRKIRSKRKINIDSRETNTQLIEQKIKELKTNKINE